MEFLSPMFVAAPSHYSIGQTLDFHLSRLRPLLTTSTTMDYCSTKTITSIFLPLLGLYLYFKLIHVPWNERPVKFEWNVPREATPGWSSKEISNASISSHKQDLSLLPKDADPSKSYITCYAPASGSHLSTISATTREEIDAAISKAEIAQKVWKKSDWSRRRRVMRSLLKWCTTEMEGIARVASRDTGKTLVDAAFGEILTTCEKLRWVIANGEDILKPQKRPTNMILAHKTSRVRYEPLGVVAAIVSWNYPAHNALSPIIAALFSGNAIIVKPSELVAWSSLHYIRAVRSCLSACGEPPDLVQIVIPLPDTIEHLTAHPRINHITFIGSEMIGQKVALKAAEVGTPVVLELGGKDPCIILDSADFKAFEDTWMRAAFQAAGQNCIGVERFIVDDKVYDRFVAGMASRVEALKVGDVLRKELTKDEKERIDVGAMVSDRLFDELERLIDSAVKDGARCITGGKRISNHPDSPRGHYFAPTLLVDVTKEMEIAQQEVFAPVMTVIKAQNKDEAIEIANSTRYGLGASVFGKNKKDCQYVLERVEAGMMCTNDFGVFYLNQSLPFGGCKASGHGRFSGPEGLRGLCNARSETRDLLHGWVQTGIPPLLAYPINSGAGAWGFVGGLTRMMYGDGPLNKLKGLIGLVTAK